jgi:hypothetical protein
MVGGPARWRRCSQAGSSVPRPVRTGTMYSRPSTTAIDAPESRRAVARPRLSSAIRARYRTEPAAARSVGPLPSDSTRTPCALVKPLPGRMNRAASTEHSTAAVPAASTTPVTTVALAARAVARRGTAVSVIRIMPLLYSPVIISTARTATAAWPGRIPVRLSLVVSWPHEPGHFTTPAARALAPTVSAIVVSSSHPVLGTVRSLVHSACRASRRVAASVRGAVFICEPPATTVMHPCGAAGTPRRPTRRRPRRRARRTRPTVPAENSR